MYMYDGAVGWPEDYERYETLGELLRLRAKETPKSDAFTFLDGDRPLVAVTNYVDLDHQARSIAGLLQEYGAEGERALLMFPPGLDFVSSFFGCLYAGVTAVPVYPPNPGRVEPGLRRLVPILEDADAAFVLTSDAFLARAEAELPSPRSSFVMIR